MPQTRILSAPVPVWDYWFTYPNSYPGANPGQQVQTYLADFSPWQRNGATSGSNVQTFNPGGGVSGGGIGENYGQYKGQHCVQYTTTAAIVQAFRPWILPWFKPMWGAGNMNAGYRQPSGVTVTVFDIGLIMSAVNAVHGFLFCPYSGAAYPTPANDASGVGGFGIVADGAGSYNLNTYTNAGVLITSYPAGAIADNTLWSNFRLLVKTGSTTSGALLSASVNGTDFVTDLEFGSANLELPDANLANAYTFCPVVRLGNNASGFWYRWAVKAGRFLPDGTEVATA